ncbi:uncharacterized protein A4U43_C04F22120 [Asparagus officinalis]|uniref:Uncharacterized protein n=1 Tax=Asparagus officinalis TaxID=4686 RepID=A0A5P1F4M8_ASPOF|nr:uncharacterized protein A4U43_C04F22120 [Asparagus officinalis]
MATYEKLFISHNPDGSLCRNYPFPFTPPTHQQIPSSQNPPFPSLSKDVPLNSAHETSIRIFIPQQLSLPSGDEQLSPSSLLPFLGASSSVAPPLPRFHDFTASALRRPPAVVPSPFDHARLAPTPLPAALRRRCSTPSSVLRCRPTPGWNATRHFF